MTLDQLALAAKTDKASDGHNYTKVYETYLEPLRYKPLTIFELGIGGYQYPDRGGESLKLWYQYFPKANIVGVDFYEKKGLANDRTFIMKGSQNDPAFAQQLVDTFGRPDLIIDDASHVCSLTIKSFEIYFPHLTPGGLYFCEDIHTSFWSSNGYEGDEDPNAETPTTVKFFQKLTPQLSQDTLQAQYRNSYAGYLDFIHFYRNLAIIKKA